jgi:hypothetical protein
LGHEVVIPAYTHLYERYLLPIVREPDRFDLLLAVPISVIAGWGMQGILRKLSDVTVRGLFVPIAVGLIALDSIALPHHHLSVAVPAWYVSIANDPDDYGVLEVPMSRSRSEHAMLYQLTHRKALVHGHVSRVPEDVYAFIESVPLLRHLHNADRDAPPPGDFNLAESLDLLRASNIRYVVIHRRGMDGAWVRAWRRWFPFPPRYESAELLVYRTAWREPMTEQLEQPVLPTQAELLERSIVPASTVPGGWVDVKSNWYVPADAVSDLRLSLYDDGEGAVDVWPEVTFLGSAVDRRDKDDLVWRRYRVQIPPDIPPGTYVFCFTDDDTEGLQDPDASPFCYDYAVEARARIFTAPPFEHEVGVSLGDAVELVGFTRDESDAVLRLQIVWRAKREMARSYRVFVHVVDAQTGRVAAQEDFIPRDWSYPTHYWRAGEYVTDDVILDLGALSVGSYEVKVGLYRADTGERLATDPAYPDDAILLTTVTR